jgi:DNA-binding PadR family transcriptional regulator
MKNVVLAQLIQRRGYGYELQQRLSAFLTAQRFSDSALYAALMSLQKEGLIAVVGREAQVTGGGPQANARVLFEATPKGHAHFEEWMATSPKKAPLREDLHMQLLVAEESDIPALVESLKEVEEDCRLQLGQILDAFEEQEPQHARISPFGAPLVKEALLSHLQATMEWAKMSRRALEHRQAANSGEAPSRNRP